MKKLILSLVILIFFCLFALIQKNLAAEVIIVGDPAAKVSNTNPFPVKMGTGETITVDQSDPNSLQVETIQRTPTNHKIQVFGDDTTSAINTDTSGDVQVDVLTSALPSGAATEASLTSIDGKITTCNTGAVTVSSSALPSGAATEASLTSIDGKITACDTSSIDIDNIGGTSLTLGQKTSAASIPVVLPSDAGDVKITLDSETVTIGSITAGDNNIGNVDILTLPSGNLGQQNMAASLSIVPASNIADTTYIGDIKFGESLPAGTNVIGGIRSAIVFSRKETSQDLSSAVLNYTTNFAANIKIKQIFLHASVAITETISLYFDSVTGANYDTLLSYYDLVSESYFAYIPSDLVLLSGDELTITCTNNNLTGTVYVTVIGEVLL